MPTLAIARLTAANGLRQPVTWLCTALGLAFLLLCMLFGVFTFETEDRMRILLTAGVAVAMLNGLFLAVVGASAAVHDELASRTALTLFAKPIGRGHFLLGKALGVGTVVVIAGLVLMLAHLAAIALVQSQGFDLLGGDGHHHHGHDHDHDHHDHGPTVAWLPWGRVVAGHVLAWANAGVLVAIATALAIRLPLVANILICFGLFVLAHLAAGFGHATSLAGLLPALALFNVDEALQFRDLAFTPRHFILCLTYAALYAAGSLLVGLAVFRRQDIP